MGKNMCLVVLLGDAVLADVKQLCLHLVLDSGQLYLGVCTSGSAFLLDLHYFIQSADQGLVRLSQGLDVNDTSLVLLRGLDPTYQPSNSPTNTKSLLSR